MTIETGCGGCGRRLRVADEHAGKLARCPNCNTIYRVPSPDGEGGSPSSPSASSPPASSPPASPSTASPSTASPSTANPATAEELAAELRNLTSAEPAAARPAPAGPSPAGPSPAGPSHARPPAEPAVAARPTAQVSMWRMRTPEGQVYGPVPRHELNLWVREGRVSSDCELCENDGSWLWADSFYPELARVGATRQREQQDTTYYAPPGAASRSRGLAPDRGSTVLALGIMAWVVICPLLSLSAWVMAAHDLGEMRAGRMTSAGRGMTQAGMTLGIVHCVCAALFLLIALLAGVR